MQTELFTEVFRLDKPFRNAAPNGFSGVRIARKGVDEKIPSRSRADNSFVGVGVESTTQKVSFILELNSIENQLKYLIYTKI